MTAKIKNCGLKTREMLHVAATNGASFVGFVHYPPSPRHLSLEEISGLLEVTPLALRQVVVLVDPSNDLLTDIQRHFRPHFLQIHGVADPERIADIRKRTAMHLITAITVRSREDIAIAPAMEEFSDFVMFDGAASGSGQTFDWSLLADVKTRKPWFLAGGLNPGNVAEALHITKAPMVDVSSGIESSPGVKSEELIAAFNRAVLNASHG